MKLIDKIIVKYLLSTSSQGKVFFASLLTLMKKQESKQIDTAGVTISDGQLYLLYNPDFINAIKDKYGINKVKGILEHELLHIVYDHISKVKKFNRIHKVYNIASDMSINQLIDKELLPDKLPVTIDNKIQWVGKLLFPQDYKLPKNKDAEFYYNQLMKNAKQCKCSTCGGTGKVSNSKQESGNGNKSQEKDNGESDNKQGNGDTDTTDCPACNGTGTQGQTLDDHSHWKEIKENEQMVKEVIKKAVKEAYDNTNKLRGTLPSHLEEAIQEILKPPTINWRQLLKQYIGSSIKTGFKSSWKRPNRRFPFNEAYKGKTANRTIKIMVAIDTSGSVSNKDFQDFIVEMKGILNVYKCKIDIIQCDVEIQKKEQLNPYTKLNINFKGRGGTRFVPVFKEYNQRPDYDLLIYFTDGYGDQESCKSNKSVIWVLTQDAHSSFKSGCSNDRIVQIQATKE